MDINTPLKPVTKSQVTGQEPWTIRRIMDWSGAYLRDRGFDSARLDVELLLAGAIGCERLRLYLEMDRPLTPEERDGFRKALKRRGEGEPIAYIRGERDFMGHVFTVSPSVLIPRPDTEVLVEQALALDPIPERTLDIGTGSGCIAVSLSHAWPDQYVEAWDIDSSALTVAQLNNEKIEANVVFRECNALDVLGDDDVQTFDLIISNPPYIDKNDLELSAMVKKYEPKQALFCDADGLSFYRHYAAHAIRWLNPGGWLMVEIGYKQAPAVEALFRDAGLHAVETVLDYGKRPRVVKGRKSG